MSEPNPVALMALATLIAALGAYGFYVKHKIRQIDRRLDEAEAANAREHPSPPAP